MGCKEGYLCVMLDCSRNAIMSISGVKSFIDKISAMGYNALQLYTEDTYEIIQEPLFGYMRGRYTQKELKEIDAYAKNKGIELIPCIQTLGHLDQLFSWQRFQRVQDIYNILLVGEEETYQLIEQMFVTCAECFTSRNINIGMDEAHMLGLGRYLDKHGYHKRSDILLTHLKRVCEIAKKYGFKPMMWSDMFFKIGTEICDNKPFARSWWLTTRLCSNASGAYTNVSIDVPEGIGWHTVVIPMTRRVLNTTNLQINWQSKNGLPNGGVEETVFYIDNIRIINEVPTNGSIYLASEE